MLDGTLRMWLMPGTLSERKETAFVALRQQHDQFYLETTMEIPTDLKPYECVGLAYLQNEENQIRLELYLEENQIALKMNCFQTGKDAQTRELELPLESVSEKDFTGGKGRYVVRLRMEVTYLQVSFEMMTKAGWRKAGGYVDARHLSTEVAGGFTGCVAGVYASSNGKDSDQYIEIHHLEYGELV